ncbi:OLC1v1031998C1 [Oldenlandia corymbosa var. corymbosa]|uniref:ubiquitinyl hydrolase 1 n=1 Tax=Oldenlandia corymbosa var. corymbosa TaxID=529605 RepID=A0AAV1CJX2_OLDCO|nr:OLC1v1031998C1 [Oldenlandia corymbosa var. corymbosa]
MPISELYDLDKGYVVDDTLVVVADVSVNHVGDNYLACDSKKETSFVGLENQGATCYMNSLLQTLYHIPYFRKSVYHMPTTENDEPSKSIPLALQSLFYKLQCTITSVGTKELTKSFGWDRSDSFTQQDVQELNRVLCEKLEDKMKGTVVEGTMRKLFEGNLMNYIECIDVEFKSTRKETFYDLQLDVKGCDDVYASFDKYVEVERLDGENKYQAEGHGLQDAKKGVLFTDFPPVLQLHLKRFEYDVSSDSMVKINDRYEFPLQLDLDREDGKYLSPDSDRSVRNLYTLHSVLVHSGGLRGGHYYAFIRPNLDDQWYKFNDERVTKEDEKQALEEQYGGEGEYLGFNINPVKFTKSSSAYMLVYIRESDKDKIICDVDEKDIAEHLRVRLKKEQEEKETWRRDIAEAHLYTKVRIAHDEDLRRQIGKDVYFGLVDLDKTRSFRVHKRMPFSAFKEEIAREFGVPVECQCFWLWARRYTNRPRRPLTPQEEAQKVGKLTNHLTMTYDAELELFLEVEYDVDSRPVPPPKKAQENTLIFFKLYDPEKQEIRYVGRCYVKKSGKIAKLLSKAKELAGCSDDEEIAIFEESRMESKVMCKRLDTSSLSRSSWIEEGVIICFQKVVLSEQKEQLPYPDVPSYFEYVQNRLVVHFRNLEKPDEDDFCLELVKNNTYDDVVKRVAEKIGLDDPLKIRLTSHNCITQKPDYDFIKYRPLERLGNMLSSHFQVSNILYYEVLEIPLPELQSLKTLEIAFHPTMKDKEVTILKVKVPKTSTVEDVLKEVKTKVGEKELLTQSDAELRLFLVYEHKILKIFTLADKIENVYGQLRAEEILEEEKNLGPNDRLIQVYHFTMKSTYFITHFGEPFFLAVHEGETLEEVKMRIRKRLQVPDEKFSKWKFATNVSLFRPAYLEDTDVVLDQFHHRRNVYGTFQQFLGLEHCDSTPPKTAAGSCVTPPNPHTSEKTVMEVEMPASQPESEDDTEHWFYWPIKNFSQRLKTKKLFSKEFEVGGNKWRVTTIPKCNNVNTNEDYLSIFLCVADSVNLPLDWSYPALYSLAIVDQIDDDRTVMQCESKRFSRLYSEGGFRYFMTLRELRNPNKGFLVNDTLLVKFKVEADSDEDEEVKDCWTYDSKKETGFVGLENQGATCYMNSLLQTLYHIPYFRKSVYHMPTTENDVPSKSIPLALQSLFYKLQCTNTSVGTKDLTKSFGWDTSESFMQQDVQELNRVLCEKLEDKMKGTVVEGTIQELFEGHQMNYFECVDINFKSTRKESFYDLQLDVKGCDDVYASFDKYVEVEQLDGENKYHAEGHGLQDAKKGVLLTDFPPVLQLHLKRFEYDVLTNSMVKINDRYEFPVQLDLDREDGKYLSPDSDKSVRNLYTLHSVLVHRGGVRGGHYYAFIRPALGGQWYKFNDQKVTKEDEKQALEEQYGGKDTFSNAYMLVYIRESDKDKIVCDVDENDIAEHLRIRLKKEEEEKEEKLSYESKARLFTNIMVASDQDLREQIGKDIQFDLVNFDKVRSFLIPKELPFRFFKEEVARELGIPVEYQRFWIWGERENETYRPDQPLTPLEEEWSVGWLSKEVSITNQSIELDLFLEVEYNHDLIPLPPPERTSEDILIFLKFYDPEKKELRYVGRLFVKSYECPDEIMEKLNELAGSSIEEDIEIFEERQFKPEVVFKRLDICGSFKSNGIGDGDILCFQKLLSPELKRQLPYPDVVSYFKYLKNRQVVRFRSLEYPKEDEFCLELAKNHGYDDVVNRVAEELGLDDPSKIQLTSHNSYTQKPKPEFIPHGSAEHLSEMLVHYGLGSDILYYKVLNIPLPELQSLKTLEIAFCSATKRDDQMGGELQILNVELPKKSIVEDVLEKIKTEVELSQPNAELRLVEIVFNKITKIFPLEQSIENMSDYWWIKRRAEEIPEEEKNIGPGAHLIRVVYFTVKKAAFGQREFFGEPFFLVVHEREKLGEVKLRIQKRLQVPDEEFSKWKFAEISHGSQNYIEDREIVVNRFKRKGDFSEFGQQYLGLEHPDNTPKRACLRNRPREVGLIDRKRWRGFGPRQVARHPCTKLCQDITSNETKVCTFAEVSWHITPRTAGSSSAAR